MRVRRVSAAGFVAVVASSLLSGVSPAAAAPTTNVINYPDFSSAAGLNLMGSASVQDNKLTLTPPERGHAGAAWASEPVDASAEWHTTFRASLHHGTFSPADGVALVFNQSPDMLGEAGGGIGYSGLGPSVAVEFDTFKNAGEPNDNHIAVHVNGDVAPDKALAWATPPFWMGGGGGGANDGNNRTRVFSAWVDYDPSAKQLSVYADPGETKPAVPVLTTTVDMGALLPGGSVVGLTAATGGLWQQHDILSWSMDAASRAPGPGKYVALGDSYQSGEGTFNYYPETNIRDTNMCHRSPDAYAPRLVDRGWVTGLELSFVACGGAVIDDLPKAMHNDTMSQLDRLDASTRLVTIGIGGNDVEFSKILVGCIMEHALRAESCQQAYGERLDRNLAALTTADPATGLSRLQTIYQEIRRRAPFARVAVVGYPRFFVEGGRAGLFGQYCEGVRVTDQRWINAQTRRLDEKIRDAASSVGMQFVNLYDTPAGDELCSDNDGPGGMPFLNGIIIDAERRAANPGSYHPTAWGQELMTGTIGLALQQPAPGQYFTVRPGQTISYQQTVVGGQPVGFSTQWPGSDVVMSLRSPSGRVIERGTQAADVRHLVGPTYETYLVENAEPGPWTVSLFGAQVAAGGEETRLHVYEQPKPNQLPQARFALSENGRSVTVDAGASTDPDGRLVEYLWDFGDGTTATGSKVTHTYTTAGTYLTTLAVKDDAGGEAFTSADHTVTVPQYTFTGFFSPVDPMPAVNSINAGRAVPIKFSLGKDEGLDILAAGSPNSVQVDCQTLTPVGQPEPTATSGSSTLSYDPKTKTYSYVWKTTSQWAGTCRKFRLTLADGSTHEALFRFR